MSSMISFEPPTAPTCIYPPPYFCPELISEYLSYLPIEDVERCSQIGRHWVGPSRAITLRTLHAERGKQVTSLQHYPEVFGGFVRTLVIPLYLDILGQSWLSHISYLTKLEVHGKYVRDPSQLAYLVQLFSPSLKSFICHGSLSLCPISFSNLLVTLSHCEDLRHLCLPILGGRDRILPEIHTIYESNPQYSFCNRNDGLITLRLAPTPISDDPPQAEDTLGAEDWGWLSEDVCPINICNLTRLVVGNASAARLLLPRLDNLQTLEFISLPDEESRIQEFIELVPSLPLTLTAFVVPCRTRISYRSFSEIIKALGRWVRLRYLTLPNPCPHNESRAEISDSFQMLSPRIADRPPLDYLQLVSVFGRKDPRPITCSYKGTADVEWQWIEDALCPFDLHHIKTLVVGSAQAAQRLFPLVHNNLTRLEFCSPFDTRKTWNAYSLCFQFSSVYFSLILYTADNLQVTPLLFPHLAIIQITAFTWPSSWLLDFIKAPEIENFVVKWTSNVSPLHLQTMFQRMDGRIARLDPTGRYPRKLMTIRTIGSDSAADQPDSTWYRTLFTAASIAGVEIFVSYETGAGGG